MKLIFLFFLLLSCSHKNSHPEWSYAGESAPYHWGEIDEDFKQCESGTQQSPINLKKSKSQKLAQKVTFNYQDLKGVVINNGHSIEIDFDQSAFLTLEGKKYFLRQMHFHAKSEHALNGVFYPAELHIVHESQDRHLAVVGIFIEIDDDQFDSYGFFQSLPAVGVKGLSSEIKFSKILKNLGGHFYYQGSLTTPPCTEDVHWLIFDRHLKLSTHQLKGFESLYSNNYRPLQPLKGRHLFFAEEK